MGGHHHGHGGAHDHHSHSHCHGNAGRKQLGIAAVLTGLFMIAEVIGGLISGSLALLADAGHMLTDFAALSMAWGAFVLAGRPATSQLTFGYARLPVLVAFVNGITLFAISIFIIIEAARRFGNMDNHEILAGTMFWVALAGLLVNIVVFLILRSADKDNLNVRGAVLHVIGDMLGSAAAIIAALVIMRTGYKPIDPLLSVFVALLILRSAWFLIKDSGHILLEGAPKSINSEAIQAGLSNNVEGLVEIQNIHIWSLTDGQPMMTLEVAADERTDRSKLKSDIRHRLSHDFGVTDVTIEVN